MSAKRSRRTAVGDKAEEPQPGDSALRSRQSQLLFMCFGSQCGLSFFVVVLFLLLLLFPLTGCLKRPGPAGL